MRDIEEVSDKKIPPSSYYILKIEILGKLGDSKSGNILENNAKCFLRKKYAPVATYSYSTTNEVREGSTTNEVREGSTTNEKEKSNETLFPKEDSNETRNQLLIIFSSISTEGATHYLKGSHQLLCSEFCSKLTLIFKKPITIKVIEIKTRTELLAYLQYIVFQNMRNSFVDLAETKVSSRSSETKIKSNIKDLTLHESVDFLEKKGVIWKDIPKEKKYGVFYKYDKTQNKIIRMSEMIDLKNKEKYEIFFFR